jgi:DNA-directed RNA polymerase specialized sigma24 family protein
MCLDELRRGRKVGVVPIEAASQHPDGRRDPGEVTTDRLDLAAAVATLSPDTRAALLLVYVDGMDYHSATEVLGVSRGTPALDGTEEEGRSPRRRT